MTVEYKTTDFVQVEHERLLESGEPSVYWRNALYVRGDYGNHTVLYTDSTLHMAVDGAKIRKAKID